MRSAKILASVLAVVLLLGAGSPGAFAKDVTRWKLATLAPKGLGYAILVESILIPWVKQQTDDGLRLKVYYGGVMGNDQEYLEKMAIGQLNGAALDAMGANMACPEMTVLGLPFLFNNYEEVDHIREVMYPTFDYYFQQYGYKFWLWFDQDFDQIYSAKWKFDKIEDFPKSKFQAWYGPLETTMLKDLGANPVEVPPTDASTAYREGIIDSNIGPAIFQVGTQMYTSCKYINPMKTRYCPAAIVINLSDWEKLDEDTREKLSDSGDTVRSFTVATRKDNARCIEGMVKYGLQLVEMTPENKAVIVKQASKVYDDLADKLYPKDLLLEVERYLAAYRAGRPMRAAASPRNRKVMDKDKMAAAMAAQEKAKAAEEAKKADEEAAQMMARLQEGYQKDIEAQKKRDAEKKAAGIEKTPEARPEAAAEKREEAWKKRKRQTREAQEVLASMGLYPARMVDGIFGPMTRKGIQEYQRQKGLAQTGSIDNATLKAMGIE